MPILEEGDSREVDTAPTDQNVATFIQCKCTIPCCNAIHCPEGKNLDKLRFVNWKTRWLYSKMRGQDVYWNET